MRREKARREKKRKRAKSRKEKRRIARTETEEEYEKNKEEWRNEARKANLVFVKRKENGERARVVFNPSLP